MKSLEGFHRAEMVELHDRNLMICCNETDEEGWSQFSSLSDRLVIDGDGLNAIAEHFGFEPGPRIEKSLIEGKKPTKHLLRETQYAILRRPRQIAGRGSYGDSDDPGDRISQIWVKEVDGRRLEIRFAVLVDADAGKTEDWWRFVTYSGSYSIWWPDPDAVAQSGQ